MPDITISQAAELEQGVKKSHLRSRVTDGETQRKREMKEIGHL